MYKNKCYCYEHRPTDDTVNNRLCKICDMEFNSKYMCKECNQNRHPKEFHVINHIKKYISKPFIMDRRTSTCSNKRPDLYFNCNGHNVIVEIDENQHKSYSEVCECARLNDIFISLDHKSLTVIRFNPDKVKHKNKIVTFSKEERFKLLIKTIECELNRPTEGLKVNLIQLYYNDSLSNYMPYKESDITDIIVV